MKTLEIKQTSNTPWVLLDKTQNKFRFQGKSFPENTADFYEPVIAWLDGYSKEPNKKTVIEMQFDYFNTSSAKMILEVFKKIKDVKEAGSDVLVRWKYLSMDEEMQEVGEEYEFMVDIPFEYVEIEDDFES
ncbi:MAG: hypothetical protein RIS47_2299 [Bacteroidota bacterium]